jgi:dTDP-4-dehydrorhamnose reductase
MRILVVGASGLMGWNCLKVMGALGHELLGTYHTHAMDGLVPLSLDSDSAVSSLVARFQPAAVICCAAWSWVDGCQGDPARAFRNNRDEPARLARHAHDFGASFVHFSSSYVFDGKLGPYCEEDLPNPLSVYGESKLAGEKAVLDATDGSATIVRTMGVYGEEPQKKNFVYQVRANLSAGRRMKVPLDQFGNASYAPDIATGVARLLVRKLDGIWNLAGPDPNLCRKDFALRIAREYGLDESLFDFVSTEELRQPAPRPRQGGLRIEKARTRLLLHFQDFTVI